MAGSSGSPPYSFAPHFGYTGTDSFSYRICDGLGACSSFATVTLNINNSPPVADPDQFTIDGTTQLPSVLANDDDPDGDFIHFDLYGSQPQHGYLVGSSGSPPYSYTPNFGYTGTDSFTYRVCDDLGGCSSYGTVTLLVVGDGQNDGVCSPCNQGGPMAVGGPVNVSNGNMYLQETDYSLPGAGPAINITRTYNSNSQGLGLFGRGWSTAYDESIVSYDSSMLRFSAADGRTTYFGRAVGSSGAFAPLEGDFHGQVSKNGDGSFTLSLTDGSVRQFNSAGKLLSLTDRKNNTTALTYGGNGFVSSITDPFGRVVTMTTNGSGRVLSLSDTMGTIATYTYGGVGQLLSVAYADTSSFSFTYDGNYRLTNVADALGNSLESHSYDGQGRAITSARQGGVEQYTLTYVSATQTDVSDALGHVTKYTIDKSKDRNVVTRVEGLCGCGGGGSQVQTWTYDNQINVISKTDSLNHTTSYTYDGNGNRLTETDVSGTATYTYNQFGEVLTATDKMSGVTTNTFDAQGNLLTTKDALNNTTTLTYDSRGQLLTVTDARAKITTLTWDTSGRLTQVKDALNNTTGLAYDARARRTSATNALNQTTGYAYDAAGRPNKLTYPDANFVQFTYDLAGRRTKVKDARGNDTDYGYDSAYRQTSVTNAGNAVTSNSYDLMSHLTGVTDALGRTTNYVYDDFNRLKQVTYPEATPGAGRLIELFAYDAGGNLTQKTDQAGRITTLAYDSLDRLTSSTDPALKVTSYEYNARSQMTALVDALNQRYTFGYDALGRTTQTTRAGTSMSYVYDVVGNRTASHRSASYGHQPFNKLTSTATATYTYDNNGNVLSKIDPSGTTQFTWDYENRLTRVTKPGGQTIDYKYDALSRRIQRTPSAGVSSNFVYNGRDVVSDLNSDGSRVDYLNGLGIDNKLRQSTTPAPLPGPGGIGLIIGAATALYYQTDHLGSTTALTDALGNVVERESYDAFGNTAGSALTRYGYTGRELDPDTGLMYYRARWYDPQVGKFISEDPINFEGGINWYAYADNNPIRSRDALGLCPCSCTLQLRATRIDLVGGWVPTPAYHLYITTTDSCTGKTRAYRAGPDNHDKIEAIDGPFDKEFPDFIGHESDRIAISIKIPSSCEKWDNSFTDTTNATNRSQIDYSAGRNNSNAFAYTALDKAGARPYGMTDALNRSIGRFGTVPGWGLILR